MARLATNSMEKGLRSTWAFDTHRQLTTCIWGPGNAWDAPDNIRKHMYTEQTTKDFCPRLPQSWVRDRRLRLTSHVEPTGVIGMSSLSFWISHMRCHSISRAKKKSFARLKLFPKCRLWKDSLGRFRSKQPSPRHPIVPIYADGRTKTPLPQAYRRPGIFDQLKSPRMEKTPGDDLNGLAFQSPRIGWVFNDESPAL